MRRSPLFVLTIGCLQKKLIIVVMLETRLVTLAQLIHLSFIYHQFAPKLYVYCNVVNRKIKEKYSTPKINKAKKKLFHQFASTSMIFEIRQLFIRMCNITNRRMPNVFGPSFRLLLICMRSTCDRHASTQSLDRCVREGHTLTNFLARLTPV